MMYKGADCDISFQFCFGGSAGGGYLRLCVDISICRGRRKYGGYA